MIIWRVSFVLKTPRVPTIARPLRLAQPALSVAQDISFLDGVCVSAPLYYPTRTLV